MIEFASLGSGSGGNATLVRAGGAMVLVDCGFSAREAVRRAALLGVDLSALDAVVVTHEHGDHIKGVAALSRRFNIPVYMTPATRLSRKLGELATFVPIEDYQPFNVAALEIYPVPVPHDAADPVQYLFKFEGTRLGIVTDLGSFTPRLLAAFSGCHGLVLEANHNIRMLSYGPYPRFLKQRVGGAWGHLSNGQVRQFLEQVDTGCLQRLVLAHISETNNSVSCIEEELAGLPLPVAFTCATQNSGFSWLGVTKGAPEPQAAATF